jgi:hypothetical protein
MIKLAETRDKEGNIIPAKLDQFIVEHKGEVGDQAEFERVIRSMAGKSKEAPEASSPDGSDD